MEDILERGWVRLLIQSVFTVAFIGISLWLFGIYDTLGLPNQYSGIFLIGAATFIGAMFVFIGNNLMRDFDAGGRIALTVIGGLIILGAGGYVTFGYSSIGVFFSKPVDAELMHAVSPWIASLGGVFLLGSIIFGVFYYILLYFDVEYEILYLIVFPVSYPLAYILTVPFAFIYQASGAAFFNGWPEIILSVIAIVVIIVGHVREWEPLEIGEFFSDLRDKISSRPRRNRTKSSKTKQSRPRKLRGKKAEIQELINSESEEERISMLSVLKTTKNNDTQSETVNDDKTDEPSKTVKSPSKPEEPEDTRKIDRNILHGAISNAICSPNLAVSSYYNLTWCGQLSHKYSVSDREVHISGRIKATLRNIYKADDENTYKWDLEDRVREIEDDIERSVKNEINDIQYRYQGYDGDWHVYVNIEVI